MKPSPLSTAPRQAMKGLRRSRSRSTSPPPQRMRSDSVSSSALGVNYKLPEAVCFKDYVRSSTARESLACKKTEQMIWDDVVPFSRRTARDDFDPQTMWKFITWNVAGLRGILRKDDTALLRLMKKEQPDVLCLQETKLNPAEAEANKSLGMIPNYEFVDHVSYTKKGYSGTRVYLHQNRVIEEMNAVTTCGFTFPQDWRTPEGTAACQPFEIPRRGSDNTLWPPEMEGRVQTVWLAPHGPAGGNRAAGGGKRRGGKSSGINVEGDVLPTLALVNTYVPNSGMALDRLPYRIEHFDKWMRSYLQDVQSFCYANQIKTPPKKEAKRTEPPPQPCGVIWTGDLNVAERDFDRYFAGSFKKMQECSGFTPEERCSFRETLQKLNGAQDAFRLLYPDAGPVYTFWSARINGRAKGLGWRLDYFVVSEKLTPFVVEVLAMPEYTASDHCPVQMWLKKQ